MIKIYLFNFFIAFIVLVFMKVFKRKSAYINFLIILFIPIIGILITSIIFLCRKFIKSDYGKYVLERERVYKNNISLLIREAELKQKKDIVPIEDAIVLNSNNVKRRLIKDILKKDFDSNLEILTKALNDEDTETSHYAATAITELKSRLLILLQKRAYEYNKNPKSKKRIINYLEIIKKCIDSKLFYINGEKKLEYQYKMILEGYISNSGIKVSEKYFKELIKICIEIKQYDEAIRYANQYRKIYRYSQSPYLLLLEVYYKLKDKELFDKTLTELRESKIKLDKYSLDILRFWI